MWGGLFEKDCKRHQSGFCLGSTITVLSPVRISPFHHAQRTIRLYKVWLPLHSGSKLAMLRTEIVSHVWTAPCWQGFFLTLMRADRCCHVFGLLMRRCYMAAGHNALRRSGPSQKHAVKMLHWLKWGVLIFGSTGWVHYSSVALSNFVSARISRLSQTACDTGS